MPIFGVCYSPYRRSTRPPPYPLDEALVAEDMKIIAAHGIRNIRTYSQGNENDANWHNVRCAARLGINVALGVWIASDAATTEQSIDTAWGQAKLHPGTVQQLVVGNEVNRGDDKHYTPAQVAAAMDYARRTRPAALATIPVTTCFSGTVLVDGQAAAWKPVVQACEQVVFLTVYPYYGGGQPNDIGPNMAWSWENGLSQVAALGKGIVIAEIGWPSQGGNNTSVDNEMINYRTTKNWMAGPNGLGKTFDAYWFEMFDEPWKTAEGSQGTHWGLCDAQGTAKFSF